jgi:hypothetical protein
MSATDNNDDFGALIPRVNLARLVTREKYIDFLGGEN